MLSPIKQLTEIEMTRKEFITRIGFAALLITGIPTILKALTEHHPRPKIATSNSPKGYGASAYGR